LTETLLTQIEAPTGGNDVRTLIQTIGTISRTVGYRLGRHLDRVVPLFLRFCGDPEDEDHHTEQAAELRENCFQGFESFVLRCPREVVPHLQQIIQVALAFLKYDPNYSYGESDEEGDDDMNDSEDEFSDDDFGGSDDDDTSWKVRRSAIKTLSAVISCRPELLQDLYKQCASELISRFKEREENVRVDLIKCFETLLSATLAADSRTKATARAKNSEYESNDKPTAMDIGDTPGTPGLLRQRSAVSQLGHILSQIIKVSEKQLKGNSQKTKVAVFAMLRKLCLVLNGGLSEHMEVLTCNIRQCLGDKNQGLKLEALLFLRLLLGSHQPEDTQPYIAAVLPLIVQCAAEDWYKIIAEALRVIGQMIKTVRPRAVVNGKDSLAEGYNYAVTVDSLYEAVFARLEAHDIDQEIKECAILAMGLLLAHLGDQLGDDRRATVCQLLMDRLRNEITRMPTLKSLEAAALSPLSLDLGTILCDAVEELAYFLRQQSRSLKQMTLETLNALITHNSSSMNAALFSLVLKECAGLLTDADLHLAHLSLRVVTSILGVSPGSTQAAQEHILPRVLQLSASPLLQGLALDSLLELLRELVTAGADGLGFQELCGHLQATATKDLPKQAVANLAKGLAAIAAVTDGDNRQQLLGQLVGHMAEEGSTVQKHLALLCVGELGRQVDLSSQADDLDTILLQTFETGQEEDKTAAAYALGHLAVGNMTTYLPLILQALTDSRHQYLLLAALKEVIVCHAASTELDFGDYVDEVLPHLYRHCETPEEGVRNMVAECLGALASMHPSKLIPGLLKLSEDNSGDAFMRWTIVTALKYCVSHGAPTEELNPHMEQFLTMLRDEDLDVRKACLLLVNASAHHQPLLVSDLLAASIMPVICETIELRLERVVDLGPFKHKVDDGLPLRKAALSCVDTVLDTLPERLDVVGFMPFLATGLGDSQGDVQQLCHQILIKICSYQPGAVLGSLESLVEPLEKTVNKRVKDSQVGTEVERANDLIRSALRAVVAISMIEDASSSRQFTQFMERLEKRGSDKLKAMLQSIEAEQNL